MIFDEHEDSSANVTDLLPEERRELLVEMSIMNARVAMLGIAGTMEQLMKFGGKRKSL